MSIKITNSRIINFYKANPSQDIERNNIFLIEFIEKIKQDLENGINTSETLQYLDNFKHLVDGNFKTLETKVSEIDVSSEIKALESKMQLLNKETEQISEIISILNSQKTNFTKELESMIKNTENKNVIVNQAGWGALALGRIDLEFSKKNGKSNSFSVNDISKKNYAKI